MIDLTTLTFSNLTGVDIIIIFFKLFSFAFSAMYFVFTLVVVRQVSIMSKIIEVKDDGVLNRESFITLFAKIQVVLGIAVLLFAIQVAFF